MKIKAISGWRDPHIRPAPVPPVEVYEAWLRQRNRGYTKNQKVSAQALRRAVIMRRQGETWKDCGAAVGHDGATIRGYCEFLPLDLRP